VEGFAAGLPVLASNIDGPAEIIDQLAGGFLFETGNFKSCAQALLHILQLYENEEIEERMNTTLQLVANRYSIQHCTRQYLQEYQKLTG
jgi:glycosyltransferase involved in cell wall biosynthesis